MDPLTGTTGSGSALPRTDTNPRLDGRFAELHVLAPVTNGNGFMPSRGSAIRSRSYRPRRVLSAHSPKELLASESRKSTDFVLFSAFIFLSQFLAMNAVKFPAQV